jgi:uncharacterized protein YaaQ
MAEPKVVDKIYVVSVSGETAASLREQLVKNGFYFTQIESSGGIIQKDSVSLLIGINQARAAELQQLIQKVCKRRRTYVPARTETVVLQTHPLMIEAEVGGALVYSLDVERFEQF